MITKIETIEDVKAFAKYLSSVEKVSFHPDDDFNDYIKEGNSSFYSPEEAELRNTLMDECFYICENNNVDIYEIMFQEVATHLQLVVE